MMRNPEDIMADYLLKGGKMLDKACPECGSPLFTVKGDTFCVVCSETGGMKEDAPMKPFVSDEKTSPVIPEIRNEERINPTDDVLYDELRSAIVDLCGRIKKENRPKDCFVLMESVSIGIDALKRL